MLYVDTSPVGGRGLFTDEALAADQCLLTCPVLIIPATDWDAIAYTVVGEYVFDWAEDGSTGLVLGAISLINHSATPNTQVFLDGEAETADLWTLTAIPAGAELTVRYRSDDELWFHPA